MKRHKQTKVYADESKLFYVAIFCLVSVFVAYIYFVSMSVLHVVMRKEVDTQIAAVGTNVAGLEERYIEMQHSVSSDIASLQGFVTTDHKVFIDKSDTVVALSR
jgi:hypothetical protein